MLIVWQSVECGKYILSYDLVYFSTAGISQWKTKYASGEALVFQADKWSAVNSDRYFVSLFSPNYLVYLLSR